MTARERRELIEKKENGMLTDVEHGEYLNLLKTDATFYEEVSLHQLLTDTMRQQADSQLWASFETALAQVPGPKKKPIFVSWVYQNAAFAMAACIALLIVGVWLFRTVTRPDGPQIVKIETNYLFRADGGTKSTDGQGYAGGDTPIGELPVKWIQNEELTTAAAYLYCHDTLTVFIRNNSDTLYLQNARLRYNSKKRSLSVERPNQSLTIFNECRPTPQPF